MMRLAKNSPSFRIKTIRQGDSDFHINNGIVVTPRAGFEISHRCPEDYKHMILECVNRGWIKPVAHIKESDYMWEKLGE